MVSGRIYGGFGIDGFETLRPMLLAAMAANLPTRGDDGVATLIEDLKSDPIFYDDKAVRNFVWTTQQMVQTLSAVRENDVFRKAAHAFSNEKDLTAETDRLREILANVVSAFEKLRKERLRAAPLDEERMELVRQRITESVLADGPGITCFGEYVIRRDASGAVATTETEFGVIDKGSFVVPEMSAVLFDDLPGSFVYVSRDYLASLVWRSLYHRPKRIVSMDVAEGTSAFWRHVIDEAPKVGPEPIVLVPFSVFGEEISAAAHRFSGGGLTGFEITHMSDTPSGGGTAYMGTIEGIHVYTAGVMTNSAVLCSLRLLRGICYGTVHGRSDIVDFWFVESEDPTASRVRLKFAQVIEWSDHVFVEFDIVSTPQGVEVNHPNVLDNDAGALGVLRARLLALIKATFS
jgi:hypothetical protein